MKAFIHQLLKREKHSAECINFIFCTDEYLLDINQQYLHHHTYTDIITFQLSKKNESIIADIFISVERVKANSIKFKVSFSAELYRVIFHGLLHLCGYNDKTSIQRERMRNKEDFYLNLYIVSRET